VFPAPYTKRLCVDGGGGGVGGGGGGGGGGSEETPIAPVKKNYFWLYILGAGILYMAFKKKSN
jgi:hypothetical protein